MMASAKRDARGARIGGIQRKVGADDPNQRFHRHAEFGNLGDRNKGSALLVALSKFRDPKLLAELRARGMP